MFSAHGFSPGPYPHHYARRGPDAAGVNCRLPIPSEHLGSQLYCPKPLARVGLFRRRRHGSDPGQGAALHSGYPRQHRFRGAYRPSVPRVLNFSCLSDTANAPVLGCNGVESNKGVPHVGAAPHSPEHTDSCSSIAGRAAGEAFSTITESFGAFLTVSRNDTLAAL